MTKLISAALAAGIALATLSACNTVEGMGKDIKSAGKTVEKTANNAK
jgi:predicted small secreted protein